MPTIGTQHNFSGQAPMHHRSVFAYSECSQSSKVLFYCHDGMVGSGPTVLIIRKVRNGGHSSHSFRPAVFRGPATSCRWLCSRTSHSSVRCPRIRDVCCIPGPALLGACELSGRLTQQFPTQRLKSFQHLLLFMAHLAEQDSVVANYGL